MERAGLTAPVPVLLDAGAAMVIPARRYGFVMLFAVVLLLHTLPQVVTGKCAPRPIVLRLGDVQISNGKTARGVEMGIGDPQQRQAMLPLWNHDGVLLYGINGSCEGAYNFGPVNWTTDGCPTLRGGAYNGQNSKTHKPAGATEANLFQTEGADNRDWGDAMRFLDTITLNSNLSLPGFPLREATRDWGAQGYTPMHAFGLGSNSTILRALKGSAKISSLSWAFAWGRPSKTAGSKGGIDGSVVLGGYDKARIKPGAKRYTQPIAADKPQQCPSGLVVSINDMELNFPNGTNFSIFPKSRSSAIQACVQPNLPLAVRIPYDPYVDNLLGAMGYTIYDMDRAFGLNWNNLRFKKEQKPYDGAMSIKLGRGMVARLENDQLVVPHQSVDRKTGDIIIDRAEPPELLIDSMQDVNANDMAQLGMHFAAVAYLLVNYDAGQFSMWSSADIAKDAVPDLVAIDERGLDLTDAEFCAADNSTGSSPPPAVATVPAKPSPEGEETGDAAATATTGGVSLPTGALVGIVVGGALVLLLALGVIVWILLRRRRRGKKAPVTATAAFEARGTENKNYAIYQPYGGPTFGLGIDAGTHPMAQKSELIDTSSIPLYEVPSTYLYEAPAGQTGPYQGRRYELSG
ncbi:hypothetical protein MCOR25_008957 [Pyricularia grisea]|nr:hypothetical protein MCOR25_008957 [Pyricularia grisea]